MTPYTELPARPEPDNPVAIVLNAADPLFAEAVRSWGAEWESRVACWRASGQRFAVLIVTPDSAYDRLLIARDEAALEDAVDSAIRALDGAPCRWRVGHGLRSLVLEQVWRERERRQWEARRAARSRPW